MKNNYLLTLANCKDLGMLSLLLAVMVTVVLLILQFPLEGLLLYFSVPVKPKGVGPTKLEQENLVLAPELKEILVGLILGDLNVERSTASSNARLRFAQSSIHEDYLVHLYDKFRDFCGTEPKLSNLLPHKVTGLIYSRVMFNTLSLSCFNELHSLFYPAGTKIVPLNIGELLTPLALAYLICDDGGLCRTSKRLILSTNSFTLAEVELLASVLNNKWNLNCYINKIGCGYRILIPRKSLPLVQTLLKDIIPPMMLFKLGL